MANLFVGGQNRQKIAKALGVSIEEVKDMNTTQPQGPFCQSCAMPMQKPKDFGTGINGSQNQDYCRYCYQNGAFTEPGITMEQMIEKCAGLMEQMNVPEMQIEQTKTFIPQLKRWRKQQDELINKLKDARKEIMEAVNSVPKNKTQAIAFGEWTLKDLLSHLSGWAEYQIKTLRLFKKGQESEKCGNIFDFNCNSVSKRQNKSFNDIKSEFERLSDLLIQEYESLSDEQWKINLWPDEKTTPQEFINIEIQHYRKTHLPQIKKYGHL